MENYGGNGMFPSQEGYPSLDFTLLDRPSGSVVSAPPSTVPFSQGNPSFPSIDFFNGAGLDSYNDRSMSNHASHSEESFKSGLRGHASMHLTPTASQGHGAHEFFEPGVQQQPYLGVRNWPNNNGQHNYFLPNTMVADELSRQNVYNKVNYTPSSYNDSASRPGLVAGMAFTPGNFAKASVMNNMGGGRELLKETPSFPAVQTDAPNQMVNAQRFCSPSQNNGHSMPYNNGIVSHGATMNNSDYFGSHYPNQVNSYTTQSMTGIVLNDTASQQFPGVQIRAKGAPQPSHVEAGHHAQGDMRAVDMRAAGFSELRAQRQLQELLLAQQLKQQLEYPRQFQILQESHNQVSGTSYSELLHGPDTPPSQHQPMVETSMEEHRGQAASLPPANAETMGWMVDGSCGQGFSNDLLLDQNQSLPLQLSSHEESLDAGSQIRCAQDQDRLALASYSGGEGIATEYISGPLRLPSVPRMDKPMHHQPAEMKTMNLGLGFDQNIEPRTINLSHASISAGQRPQQPAEAMVRQKLKGNNLAQVNILSQSQQHFHELQLNEQRTWSSLEQQHVEPPTQRFAQQKTDPFLQNNSLQSAKNNLNDLSYSMSGYGLPQLESNPLNSVASIEQQRLVSSSSTGIPNTHISLEEHQYKMWNALQGFQSHKKVGFHSRPISEGNSGSNSSQQCPHQSSDTRVVPFRPGIASVFGQQGVYKTQSSAMRSTTSDGLDPNVESLKARQESGWKGNEGHVPSDHIFQPFSGPAGASQGAWRKYTPLNQVSAGLGTSDQATVDLLRPGSDAQQQMDFVPQAFSGFKGLRADPNAAGAQQIVGRQVSKELHPIKEADYLYSKGQHSPNEPTVSYMKALNKQAVKLVPDSAEDAQGLPYKFNESQVQDFSVEKQREVPRQQQLDPGASRISLAHLRGSQFSNQSSPQQVKLGLGPSNSSQESQQADGASWRGFSEIQRLEREVPVFVPNNKTSQMGSSYGQTFDSERTRKKGLEYNQDGTALVEGMVSKDNVGVFSAFTTVSSLENSLLDALSSSSFASRHGNHSKLVSSTNAMPQSSEYHEGLGPSEDEATREMDASSSIVQVQPSTGSLSTNASGFIGKHSSFPKVYVQPQYDACGTLMQSQISRDVSQEISYGANTLQTNKGTARQPNHDGGGMHLMRNKHTDNTYVRHIGRSGARAANLMEAGDPPKTYVTNHAKGTDTNGEHFFGVVESSRFSSGSAPVAQGNANQMMNTHQESMRRPVNHAFVWTHEPMTQTPGMGGHYLSDACKNQLQAYPEPPTAPPAASSSEESGLVLSTSSQGKRRRPSSPMTGGWPGSVLSEAPSQQNPYTKSLSFVSPHTETLSKASSRSTVQKPPLFVHSHPMQQSHLTHENLPSKEFFDARARVPPLANPPLFQKNEFLIKPQDMSRNEFASKGVTSGQTGDGRPTSGERHKSLRQHTAFLQEAANQSEVQPSAKESLTAGPNERSCQDALSPNNLNDQLLLSDRLMAIKPSACVHSSSSLLEATTESHLASPHNEGINEASGMEGSRSKEEGSATPVQCPASISNQPPLHQSSPLLLVIPGTEAFHAKKRKQPVPSLIPWHIAAAQPRKVLPSISDAELMWASATNRLPEKDVRSNEESKLGASRATRRLKFTTQLMQRLIPPPPSVFIHGNTPMDGEHATYAVSKLTLEDACCLVAHSNVEANTAPNMSTQSQAREAAMTKCLGSFMERVKQSGMELARLDCSTSVSELRGETHELEKLSIVNRMAKHHGIGFAMDSSDNVLIENAYESGHGARKPFPQKYVTAAPLPRTLPEGVKCLSL